MEKILLILALALIIFKFGSAQTSPQDNVKSYTLKDAVELAVKNSYSVQSAKIDVVISKKKIWETTAMGLPQVSASASFQDMPDIPVTLIPDFISPSIYGVLISKGVRDSSGNLIRMPKGSNQYFPLQFGTQYNATGKFNVSQLIFSGSYIVGLQASKIYHELSTQALKKSETDIKETVTNSYYLVLIAQETKKILDSTYLIISRTANEIEEMNKQGFVEETDVDQIKLTRNNIKNSISTLEDQLEFSRKLLKFQMGIDINQEISLSEDLDKILTQTNFDLLKSSNFDINSNIDFQLVNTQESLAGFNVKLQKSNYLPTLAGFYSYQKNAMRDKFNIFDSGQEWYPTSIIGLNLDIPLFSSGMRHSRVQQAKLQLEKTSLMKQQTSQAIMLSYEQARNELKTSIDKYQNSKETYDLSTRIFNKTLIKYKNGVSSSIELSQVQNQYFTAQSNYYNSIFSMLSAKNKLDNILEKSN